MRGGCARGRTSESRELRSWPVGCCIRLSSFAVLIEFQSTVDPSMATRNARLRRGGPRERLRRQGKSDADGEVRVLPLVLYSGDSPWNALGGVAEVGVTADGEVWLPLSGNYLLLDANRRAREDLPRNNLVAAVLELNAAETMGEMHARVRSLLDRLRVAAGCIRLATLGGPENVPAVGRGGGDRVAGAGECGNRDGERDDDGIGEARPGVGGGSGTGKALR